MSIFDSVLISVNIGGVVEINIGPDPSSWSGTAVAYWDLIENNLAVGSVRKYYSLNSPGGSGDGEYPNDQLPTGNAVEFVWNDTTNQIDVIIDLANAKVQAKNEIDNIAENTRLKYITSGSGQSNTYAEKASQAQKYKDAGYPADTTGYELVQAEANATGDTPTVSADSILAIRATWLLIAADIEEERRRGKINVDAAVDAAAVTIAKDAAITALEAL